MINRFKFVFVFFLCAGFLSNNALAEDIVVPDDHITIMDAMEAAHFGDTIRVKAGRYNERITIKEGVNLISFAGNGGDEPVDGDRKSTRLNSSHRLRSRMPSSA